MVLIFGDRDNIQSLILHRDVWLCGVTFKVCPIQFYQLYTIHIQLAGFYLPCISALLPSKTEHIYKKRQKGLSAITENTEPHRILLDFEPAALNAFASHHTGALLKGCYFHLCQAFNRKINEVGLKRLYETNHDLNWSLRLIPALSFVPVEMVKAAFDLVIEEIESV